METIKTFRRIRKNALRDTYEEYLMLKKLFADCPTDNAEANAMREEKLKEAIRKFRVMSHRCNDPLAHSMREEPRGISDEWGSHTEFGFLEPEAMTATDEELRDSLETMRVRLSCSSGNPDGAGNPFTSRLEFHRTPVGVAYIHEVSLNI